ncbi:hypothetical protein LCGC14_0798570 [marine sediment metagenome]|uniref:Uncharacterized protein n=1 Tax=marine sediment metagenome TaxID=412755 RepID=A0A0F9PUS1_9ZZZZ
MQQIAELAPQLAVAFSILASIVWFQKQQGYAKAADLEELREKVEEIHETVVRIDERQKVAGR